MFRTIFVITLFLGSISSLAKPSYADVLEDYAGGPSAVEIGDKSQLKSTEEVVFSALLRQEPKGGVLALDKNKLIYAHRSENLDLGLTVATEKMVNRDSTYRLKTEKMGEQWLNFSIGAKTDSTDYAEELGFEIAKLWKADFNNHSRFELSIHQKGKFAPHPLFTTNGKIHDNVILQISRGNGANADLARHIVKTNGSMIARVRSGEIERLREKVKPKRRARR